MERESLASFASTTTIPQWLQGSLNVDVIAHLDDLQPWQHFMHICKQMQGVCYCNA